MRSEAPTSLAVEQRSLCWKEYRVLSRFVTERHQNPCLEAVTDLIVASQNRNHATGAGAGEGAAVLELPEQVASLFLEPWGLQSGYSEFGRTNSRNWPDPLSIPLYQQECLLDTRSPKATL